MKRYLLFSLLIWLGACATSNSKLEIGENKVTQTLPAEPSAPPRFSEKVYFFQHKLISEWLFSSDGAFFFDMINGSIGQFIEAASEVVGVDYADKISITLLAEYQAFVLGFPKPEHPPNCYFAFIQKQGDGYAYYTYEKSLNLWERSYYGVVGAWDKEGNHENFGPRDYQTQEAFVKDILRQLSADAGQ